MSTSLADTHMSGEIEYTTRVTAVKSPLVSGRLGRRLRAIGQSRFYGYLDHRSTQLPIIERFHHAPAADGMLVTGHSEMVFFAAHLFEQVGKTMYRPVR